MIVCTGDCHWHWSARGMGKCSVACVRIVSIPSRACVPMRIGVVFVPREIIGRRVARVVGPSSALLNASRWMLQLAGVEREELGMPSRGAMSSTPERLEEMSTRQIFVLLESITRACTLSYSWTELREMCEVWGMLTQRDREMLNHQSESQKLLVVLFFLGVFRNWPRQFESWLEEVFAAARTHGQENELMDDYQERMRQELFRDP